MPVHPTFAAAFIDNSDGGEFSPHRVLGKKLRRFCLWHRLLLRTLDNPLLVGGDITFFDLRTAVGVCQLAYGHSKVRRPWLVPALIMVKAIAVALLSKNPKNEAGLNPYQRALAKVAEQFYEYCGDYIQKPEYSIIPKTGATGARRERAPQELEEAASVIAFSGWSEEYVWNLPMGKISWYLMMHQRILGNDIDLLGEQEMQYQEELKEKLERENNGTR